MNKVILVDDHKMLRKGVTTYLLENSDWTVIGEAESLAELEPLLKQLTFSEEDNIVAVVDLQLKGDGNNALSVNGYTAIQMLAEQNIPSVIFSSNATGACIEKALSIQGGGATENIVL